MGYLSPPPEPAPVVVVRDIGGVVADYQRQTALYRSQNREVRLHECRSACTLALSLPNVCVYKSSVLRFHQAYDWNTKEVDHRVSDQLFRSYPQAVRARLGYLTRKYKSLSGAELIRLGVRDCDAPKGRELQIMVAKRRAPAYVPPGEGPVARFLTRVAGNLFGKEVDNTPTASVPRPVRSARVHVQAPLRATARVETLPEFGPEPPRRPADIAGAPLELAGASRNPPGDEAAARQTKVADNTAAHPLPRIITGAWPVLPSGFTAYAPLQSILQRHR